MANAHHSQHGSGHGSGGGGTQHHHHHILPDKVALSVGAGLLFLTFVTVWIAGIDLGKFNFLVAMLVASAKAMLVCLFFMNLLYDRRENGVIFFTSFLFLAIFIVLTSVDLFFRGNVYTDKVQLAAWAPQGGPSKFKQAWKSTPELVAHGKGLFAVQCASCHGVEGKGDGPAAGALNPPPRNFTVNDGWKNGRKAVLVYKTLTEGLGNMPAFGSLPADDRWGLAQYVVSLGQGEPPPPTQEDFAKAKVDPNAVDGGGNEAEKSIPIEFAIDQMATDRS